MYPECDRGGPAGAGVGGVPPVEKNGEHECAGAGQGPRHPPLQHHTVGPAASHGLDRTGLVPPVTSPPRPLLDVSHTGGPPDQAWEADAIQSERYGTRRHCLVGITRDDLEVGFASEREQGVVRAAAYVLPPKRRSHPQPNCQLLDPGLQVLDSVDDVVDCHAASLRAGSTSPTSLSNCASWSQLVRRSVNSEKPSRLWTSRSSTHS